LRSFKSSSFILASPQELLLNPSPNFLRSSRLVPFVRKRSGVVCVPPPQPFQKAGPCTGFRLPRIQHLYRTVGSTRTSHPTPFSPTPLFLPYVHLPAPLFTPSPCGDVMSIGILCTLPMISPYFSHLHSCVPLDILIPSASAVSSAKPLSTVLNWVRLHFTCNQLIPTTGAHILPNLCIFCPLLFALWLQVKKPTLPVSNLPLQFLYFITRSRGASGSGY